ncbi:hypothetical protein BDP27DRAFT_911786 [Rhodocollybia butyracea]|uniref:Uncharacterized protein n=1 Tax=Rhodocollybia butyracea TaxID=206335 RepID=A0A9P5P461_9AGAR|nr:hypothetical protein BDP27DRAFT_911786 [Rhodocollybia butyracea]
MQTLTWKDFLHFSPSCCPQLGKIPNEKASTAPDTFSACHAPNASKLLRQSSPDLSEKDFSSRVVEAFEEELVRRGILDDPLPSDVAAILRHLEFTISRAVIITGEGDATMMLAQWLGAAGIILDVLDIRLRSVQPSLRISKQGDQNLTSFEINQEEPSKGVGIQVEKPSVLASYCADLVQPHEYTPERQENGRATLVKVRRYNSFLFGNHSHKLSLTYKFNIILHQRSVLLWTPFEWYSWNTLLSAIRRRNTGQQLCPKLMESSHVPRLHILQTTLHISGGNIPFLAILVFLLLPNTRIPTPKYPILVNPIQACNPSKWTGKLDIQLMPMPGLAEMGVDGKDAEEESISLSLCHALSRLHCHPELTDAHESFMEWFLRFVKK